MQNEFSLEPRETLRSRFFVTLPFLIVAIIAGFLWAEWRNRPSRPTEVTWTREQVQNPNIEREFLITYPDFVDGNVSERRIIRGFESERQEIQNCLEAFLSGPTGVTVRFPGLERVTVAGVFLDGRNGVIIDFKPLVKPLNLGGVNSESLFISALVRTLKSNFPDLRSVMMLIDNQVSETFAGHIDIRDPIPIE